MPKREKTPSPGPDESKFLSIYYPYPPHSTLDEEKNVKECARWLACFIGKDNLYALFHKPSSPNVIIVEVNPELTDKKMREILGEHDWSEVFIKAPAEDIPSSKIFYSTFGSRREVEKTGWKAIEIEEKHFKNFNPASKDRKVKYPYPSTSFCEPPLLTGEVSALKLFRYLPADVFPEARAKLQAPVPEAPAAPVRVVPGSAAATGGASGENSTGGKGKKGKGKGKGNAPDPTVRPTGPLTRSVESSAKAKAIHRQPAPVTAAMYAEDSDDDAGNYMAAHPGPGPANWDGEFDDGSNKEGGLPEEKEEAPEEPPAQLTAQFAGIKIKEDDGPLCPHHNKRCKSGICEWAKEQRRIQKRIANKNTGTTGQNQRQW